MRSQPIFRIVIATLMFLLALTGCKLISAAGGPQTQPVAGTAQGVPVITAAATLYAPPAVTAAATLAMDGTPATTVVPEITVAPEITVVSGGSPIVTLNDQGKTLVLHVGQRFLLNLGEGYTWSPVVADQQVVSRVPNISVIRGAQGIYEARAAGQTTLTATGDPPCRLSKPACMMPSRVFMLTIQVNP